MKQLYLVLGTIAIVTFAGVIVWPRLKNYKPHPESDTSRPHESLFPADKVENDKIVIVEGASENDIRKILQDFCNLYNKEAFQAVPRLTALTDKKYAVTFPYDMKFEIFCFFVNYVNYPMGFDRRFKTVGWATTKTSDMWITEKSADKHVMLYVSDFDDEYDNVFLTTSDHIGYKLGFAMGEETQLLERPEKKYIEQPVTITELEGMPYTDFQ
jgi:hypothetical protein